MQSGCVICYDSFDSNNKNDEVKIVATMCGHVFHDICILEWIKQSHTCPECRRYVRKGNLTKLFINFCIDNKSDYDAVESLTSFQEQLHKKDLECVEKDKKIIELQTECAASESKSEKAEKLMREAYACFVLCKLQSSRKDGKIEELQTCFARSELESLEKDGKIEELQTCFARSELENLEKEAKIKELETCFALSKRDVKKMVQQQMELNNEMSTIKQEIKQLSYIKIENQNLMKEKNSLQSELEHLNMVKRIVKECPDVKEILADVNVHVITEEGKTAVDKIASYCSLLKQELACAKEENALLQNELTKVKLKHAQSEKEKNELPTELKGLKHRLRSPYLGSFERAKQLREIMRLREKLRKFQSLSCGQSPVPILLNLPNKDSSQCKNLANSLVCNLAHEGSSSFKNQVTPITENFQANKRQKISIFDFVKKYSLFSTQSSEISVLRLKNFDLSARQKIKYKDNEDSGLSVGYEDFGSHLCLILGNGDDPNTIQNAKCYFIKLK